VSIGHLFFNFNGDLASAGETVFGALGLHTLRGDSVHVLGGEYIQAKAFGLGFRLEPNSCDFEDEYAFMLSIRADALNALVLRDSDIAAITRFVMHLLADNVGLQVHIEE